MDKHGDFFPENPRNIDELIDALAQRAAAAQRMRNSMTQEQRDELDALAAQAFGSPELMQSLAQLDDNLRALRPGEDWGGSEEFGGEQGLGLGDGTGVLQDLAELDDLAEQLSQSYGGARMDDVDLDKLARQLGDQAAVDAKTLAELERALQRDRLPQARLRRPAEALAQGDAPARQGAAQRRRQPDVRPPGPARPAPCRRGGRAQRGQPGVGVRRHRAVGRDPHGHQRGGPHGGRGRRPRRRRPSRRPRHRGQRDRGTHPGRGRAARGHVVLDGDGRPLGADEAHGARPAPADHAPASAATTCS